MATTGRVICSNNPGAGLDYEFVHAHLDGEVCEIACGAGCSKEHVYVGMDGETAMVVVGCDLNARTISVEEKRDIVRGMTSVGAYCYYCERTTLQGATVSSTSVICRDCGLAGNPSIF